MGWRPPRAQRWRRDIWWPVFRGGVWLKIAWPKCKEGRVPITDICEMGWKNSRAYVGRVERFQGLCECWEMYHGSISGWGW